MDGLGQIEASAQRVAGLVDDLVEVATVQDGDSMPLHRSELDLVALVHETIERHQRLATSISSRWMRTPKRSSDPGMDRGLAASSTTCSAMRSSTALKTDLISVQACLAEPQALELRTLRRGLGRAVNGRG